jgi:hypothetical protein
MNEERQARGTAPVNGEVATPDAIGGSRRGRHPPIPLYHARMLPLPAVAEEEMLALKWNELTEKG